MNWRDSKNSRSKRWKGRMEVERERERGQIRQQRRTESISCSASGEVNGGKRYG